MTLQFSLDAATFDSLVDEAKRRIIPRNCNWTMHGPVDPGITLLELYAALLEQRTFLADQISEPLGRALLALLGDQIRPAAVARTVLCFDPDEPGVVPPRTHMRPVRAGLERIFRTTESVAVARFVELELRTTAGIRTQLRNGVTLLPAHHGPARATIVLRYTHALPVGEWTNLLLHLDTKVLPEWAAKAAKVDPPARVRFGWQAGTVVTWFDAADVRDGTGGLRRSGLLRLRVPGGWMQSHGADAEYALVIATDAADFTYPPRLLQLVPNAVIAHHRHWCSHRARSDEIVAQSGQTLQLPLNEGLPLEDRVYVRIKEKTGAATLWQATDNLGRARDTDLVFGVDRARGVLRFGDGLQGRMPYPESKSAAQVRFEAGGGDAGNIGGYVRWIQQATNATKPLWLASNPVPAIDGEDPETFAAARARFAAERTKPERAVTQLDHQALAIDTPGVAIARAHAAIDSDPTCPMRTSRGVTTIYVVPHVVNHNAEAIRSGTAIQAPRTDRGALDAVRRHVEKARLVGHMIFVETAVYRPVRIVVSVEADPYDQAALRRVIAGELRHYLDPLIGGPDGIGWGFGAPLMPSELLRVAQRAIDESDDSGVITQVAIGLDNEAVQTCANRDIRDHELVEVRELQILIRRRGS